MADVAQSERAAGALSLLLVGPHRLAYRRAGTGRPMLLLHGITTHGVLWDGVLRALTALGGHDAVAIDLLGCGGSDMPLDVPYSLTAHADRIAEACRHLWPEPVDLVGHDLGGGIAQIMAVRHPELVRSLTLVNCVGYDYWPVPLIASMRPPILSELLIGALDRGAFALVVRRAMFHKERVTEPFVAALQAPLRTALGRKAFQHFARSLDNRDLMEIVPGLRALRVPTTVVWGLADAYLTFAIAERLVADIPGARLERVETAGHYLPFDEPERLADTLHGRAHEPG